MKTTPSYFRPLVYAGQPVAKVPHWDAATGAFDDKDYIQSLTETLNYINEDILAGKQVSEGMNLTLPHGSSIVYLQLKDGIFSVEASFLKISPKYKVPLLRRIAEINFQPLTLPQIVYNKQSEELRFVFSTPLELAQPNKIYEAIKEISVFADDLDDDFIEKYEVTYAHSPQITPLDPAESEIAFKQFKTYLREVFEYIDFFERKRWDGYIWDVSTDTLMSISDNNHVSGNLKISIDEKIRFLKNDKNTDLIQKNSIARDFLKKLDKMPQEEVLKNFYFTRQLISTKFRSSPKIIRDYLANDAPRINNDMEAQNYYNAFFGLKFSLLNLVHQYNLNKKDWDLVTGALENSAGKTWEEGAKILKKTFDQLMNPPQPVAVKKPQKSNFFSRLFS